MQLYILFAISLISGSTCLDVDTFYRYLTLNENNTNSPCQNQKAIFLQGLQNREMWATSMLDAFGQLPRIVTQKNDKDLGAFDQCMETFHKQNATEIKGKYCLYGLKLALSSTAELLPIGENAKNHTNGSVKKNETTSTNEVYLAICIPDACLPSDLFGQFGQDTWCQTKDSSKKFDKADIICVLFLGLVLLLIIVSTIYDLYFQGRIRKPGRPILLAFSLYSNGKKIVKTSQQPDQILFLNGMKVLSTCWVILCHRYVDFTYTVINKVDHENWSRRWYSAYFWGSHLSVDTFFFISGVLVTYNFLRNQKGFNAIKFYLHRYLRLTPPLAVLFFVQLTIARRIASGPQYERLFENEISKCKENWWAFFLYIQNYAVPNRMCMNHTWYLSVDMQLFILAPLILLPMRHYGKIVSSIIAPILIVITTAYLVPIFYFNDLVSRSEQYTRLYYVATHTRFPPWLLGITFGAFLVDYQTDKRRYTLKNRVLILAIWLIVAALMAFTLFYQTDVDFNRTTTKATIFYPLQNTLWAICLWWISYACITGNAFFINWFLSLSVFQILSKVSYCTYLVHFMLLLMHVGYARTGFYFNDYEALRVLFADIFISYVVGTVWTLGFESPVVILEKFVIGCKKKPRKPDDVQ